MERKLAAILCADVHGYSRLMGSNEEATVSTLNSHRKIIDSFIARHHGRFVAAGDSVLAEFASVVEAVQCAVDIQASLKNQNDALPPERRMEFRIGINLGDVIVQGDQLYGDGVNVAARLESLAEPGGILISGTVHEQIKNKLELGFVDLGQQRVKNIAESVRVFRVRAEAAAPMARKWWRIKNLCATGIFSLYARDYRCRGRFRSTSVAAATHDIRVDSSGLASRTYSAGQTFNCRAAVRQPERRPRAGIFQRRYN